MGRSPQSAAPEPGAWSPFWGKLLLSMFDSIDVNTADVEGAHAAQQKLLAGSGGGGSGFCSFAAKCVNRSGSLSVRDRVNEEFGGR